MAPTRRPNDGLLARVNFPLYTVQMITNRHCLVAGGGGSSKTGVANGFEIYEIYHNGDRFIAEEVMRHETGSNVVMNCAVSHDNCRSYLVAGQESHCQLYYVNMKIVDEDDPKYQSKVHQNGSADGGGGVGGAARRRRSSVKPSGMEKIPNAEPISNSDAKHIKFDIKSGDSIQTDFTSVDPIQRVVRISPNGKLMATGGTDGHVRIWNFPRMIQCFDITAHGKEIDDVDFSPDSKKLISIAKDGLAIVWNVETGKELFKLNWQPPDGTKYLFKRCRFGVYEGKAGKSRLFTISNPLGKVGKQTGYLHQWNTENGEAVNACAINESLSSLTVRDDGRFLAVGTMFSGTVSIFIAFSLQRVLHIPNAHSMFITGLEFLPLHSDGPPISSNSEAAVVSISVDNKVCIHNLKYRHTIPAWMAILFIIFVLFLSFVFCSYIRL